MRAASCHGTRTLESTVDHLVTLAAMPPPMPDKAASSAYLGLLRLLLYGGAYREMPSPPRLSKDAIIGFGNSGQLEMLQVLMDEVVREGVAGDFVEAGTFKGGVAMYMAGFLSVNDRSRKVWALDSFSGMPTPDKITAKTGRFPAGSLATPGGLASVQNDFARLGLDRYATLVPGWFNETLPTMPERGLKRIAILRVDSDIYSSIMETLQALYPKLSAGGYVVFDDYKFPFARKAVHDFRRRHGITSRMRWCNASSEPPMHKCPGVHDEFLYWKKAPRARSNRASTG